MTQGTHHVSAVPPPAACRAERWLREHARSCLWLLLVVSCLIRIVGFMQFQSGPLAAQHRASSTDMRFFDAWARIIAEGDWLTDRALHPYHGWHAATADAYFQANPSLLGEYQARARVLSGDPIPPGKLLWDEWYGGRTFHQEPLCPYLLAVIYRVIGTDIRFIIAGQMALGVLNTLLVCLLTRRMLGHLAGAAAGALAVGYAALPYYEMILLRETLIILCTIGLVYLATVASDRDHWTLWLLMGVSLGVAMLLKSTFVLYACWIAGALVVRHWRRGWMLAARGGALVAGVSLAMTPLVARNIAVGAGPLSISAVGPASFVAGNSAAARSGPGFQPDVRTMAEVLGQSGPRMWPAMVLTLRTHPGLGSVADLMVDKFSWAGHWYEIPNNTNFYYFARRAPVLGWLPVRYSVLAALALPGLLLGSTQRRSLWPAYAMTITALVVLLAFDVTSRLRMPLAASLFPFAALTLAVIAQEIERRRLPRLSVVAGSVAITWIVIARPLPPDVSLMRPSDYYIPIRTYYEPLITDAMDRDDLARASELLADFLAVEPPELTDVGRSVLTPDRARLIDIYAQAREQHAAILDRMGQAAAAAAERGRAEVLRGRVGTGPS
jgi:hypothetical protein